MLVEKCRVVRFGERVEFVALSEPRVQSGNCAPSGISVDGLDDRHFRTVVALSALACGMRIRDVAFGSRTLVTIARISESIEWTIRHVP